MDHTFFNPDVAGILSSTLLLCVTLYLPRPDQVTRLGLLNMSERTKTNRQPERTKPLATSSAAAALERGFELGVFGLGALAGLDIVQPMFFLTFILTFGYFQIFGKL